MSGALNARGADGRVIDVTLGVRLFSNLGIGMTYARYKADQLADLTSILQFRDEEALSDQIQVRDFSRTENTVHIQAIYMIPFTRKVQLGVFDGPSYFEAKQDVVNDYQFNHYGGYLIPEGVI